MHHSIFQSLTCHIKNHYLKPPCTLCVRWVVWWVIWRLNEATISNFQIQHITATLLSVGSFFLSWYTEIIWGCFWYQAWSIRSQYFKSRLYFLLKFSNRQFTCTALKNLKENQHIEIIVSKCLISKCQNYNQFWFWFLP